MPVTTPLPSLLAPVIDTKLEVGAGQGQGRGRVGGGGCEAKNEEEGGVLFSDREAHCLCTIAPYHPPASIRPAACSGQGACSIRHQRRKQKRQGEGVLFGEGSVLHRVCHTRGRDPL